MQLCCYNQRGLHDGFAGVSIIRKCGWHLRKIYPSTCKLEAGGTLPRAAGERNSKSRTAGETAKEVPRTCNRVERLDGSCGREQRYEMNLKNGNLVWQWRTSEPCLE